MCSLPLWNHILLYNFCVYSECFWLSVWYSETAINVNIFTHDCLASCHAGMVSGVQFVARTYRKAGIRGFLLLLDGFVTTFEHKYRSYLSETRNICSNLWLAAAWCLFSSLILGNEGFHGPIKDISVSLASLVLVILTGGAESRKGTSVGGVELLFLVYSRRCSCRSPQGSLFLLSWRKSACVPMRGGGKFFFFFFSKYLFTI